MSEDARVHREVWSLLPWLVNGRATPAQRQCAEAHLRVCADCRAELAREERLAQALTLPAAAAPDVERGLQRLLQRLDRPDQVDPGAPLPGRWRALAGTRLGLGAVATLGLAELALVGALALWWFGGPAWQGPDTAPDTSPYRTLTQPEPRGAEGPRWRVVFQEQRTLHELQALLRTQGLAIVAGPSEAGVFTLAADEAPRDAHQADAMAARLRRSPLVRFAEAVPERGQP